MDRRGLKHLLVIKFILLCSTRAFANDLITKITNGTTRNWTGGHPENAKRQCTSWAIVTYSHSSFSPYWGVFDCFWFKNFCTRHDTRTSLSTPPYYKKQFIFWNSLITSQYRNGMQFWSLQFSLEVGFL